MRNVAAAAPAAEHQRLISQVELPPGWTPLRQLACGQVNQVVLATDPSDRRFAIKTLRAALKNHVGARRLLVHEHAVLTHLQGPGVVQVRSACDGGIVMEYLPCGDLLSLAGGPVGGWIRPLAELADALARVHRLGWVHRDVRPENALFNSSGTPVWIDFQTAAEVSGSTDGLSPGSMPYASPQQRSGELPDPRDDVFSLAVTLYQLGTGTLPGSGPGGAPIDVWKTIPSALRGWIQAALAPTRSARPAALDGLKQMLEELAEGHDRNG
jgi:serine/threonine protein kinase